MMVILLFRYILKVMLVRLISKKIGFLTYFFYMQSTNVSSRHLSMHTQLKFIVKNEFVHTNGNNEVVSGLVVSTLNVAQQSSNFSNLNTVEVVVSVASLDIGIANGVLPDEQVYSVTGLVLQKVEHD